MILPLACTVRDCGLLLERQGRTLVCARRHSYDISRSGYVNLLQPNDRRSLQAGDSAAAIEARARLLAQGVGRSAIEAVAGRVAALLTTGGVAVDLGSGSGELLAAVCRQRGEVAAIGLDLSTAAADYAVRRHPEMTWVVANADRRLPLLDRTVDVVASVHGRRNPAECARVLTRQGHLVIAVPAPDDLIELRERVQGRGVERQRGPVLAREHEASFALVEQFDVREQHELAGDALRDLLRGTYRGGRQSMARGLDALERLYVTLASSVFVFGLRPR